MARGVTLDTETTLEILQMAAANVSPAAISDETGVAVPTIYRVLRESTPLDLEGNPLTAETQDGIIKAVIEASEESVICAKYKVAPQTIQILCRQAGVDKRQRKPGVPMVSKRDAAVQAYLDGEKVTVLCKDAGISPNTLYVELEKRGIAKRNDA